MNLFQAGDTSAAVIAAQFGSPVSAMHTSALFYLALILLILGLGSRIISLLLACDMMVAYLTSDMEALRSVFSDPGKFYNADPYTFLFASLLILIFGPGRFALDWLLERRLAVGPAADCGCSVDFKQSGE